MRLDRATRMPNCARHATLFADGRKAAPRRRSACCPYRASLASAAIVLRKSPMPAALHLRGWLPNLELWYRDVCARVCRGRARTLRAAASEHHGHGCRLEVEPSPRSTPPRGSKPAHLRPALTDEDEAKMIELVTARNVRRTRRRRHCRSVGLARRQPLQRPGSPARSG